MDDQTVRNKEMKLGVPAYCWIKHNSWHAPDQLPAQSITYGLLHMDYLSCSCSAHSPSIICNSKQEIHTTEYTNQCRAAAYSTCCVHLSTVLSPNCFGPIQSHRVGNYISTFTERTMTEVKLFKWKIACCLVVKFLTQRVSQVTSYGAATSFLLPGPDWLLDMSVNMTPPPCSHTNTHTRIHL